MNAPRQFGLLACVGAFAAMIGAGCVRESGPLAAPVTIHGETVEAACGQCQFKMSGKGCDLAVRIKGQSYFVDGVHIDQLGDAHAADGFCNAIRQARVIGQFKDGRFIASSFELLPVR